MDEKDAISTWPEHKACTLHPRETSEDAPGGPEAFNESAHRFAAAGGN